jgi:hypothetical protein
MTPSRRHPPRDRVTDEVVLTEAKIKEFGLEEAPADAGPSVEEIERRRRGHGEE